MCKPTRAANGGIDAPLGMLTAEESETRMKDAEDLVRKVHVEMADALVLKEYAVSKMKMIPGTVRKNGSKNKSRLETLEEEVGLWPHLLLNSEDDRGLS